MEEEEEEIPTLWTFGERAYIDGERIQDLYGNLTIECKKKLDTGDSLDLNINCFVNPLLAEGLVYEERSSAEGMKRIWEQSLEKIKAKPWRKRYKTLKSLLSSSNEKIDTLRKIEEEIRLQIEVTRELGVNNRQLEM